MIGRLNTFQKSMLQWNDLHAYNAVHVVRIQGEPEAARLETSIHATLEKRGLTFLTLDRGSNTFQYESGQTGCEIRIMPDSRHPPDALVAEMERELNRPFPCHERFCPFRFLIAPAGASYFLGVTYFHPVADAESVVMLLREIVNEHLRLNAPAFADSLDVYPDARAHLLRRHPGVVFRRLLGLPAQIGRLRRSHRVEHRNAGDMTNGFAFFTLEPNEMTSLIAAARSWRVTVNDLFMAMLMKSLSPWAKGRLESRKRNRISVGCIVNTRRQIGVDSERTFGLFLGSCIVTHDVPEGIGLQQLAEDLAEQTTLIKRHKLFLGTAMELGFARFVLRFFSPRRRRTFYPKNWPLWGGVTNMNLNSLWKQSEDDVPLDYFRGVSTGPITPLVFSITTAGERANIGISYRTSAFLKSDVAQVKERFTEILNETRRTG